MPTRTLVGDDVITGPSDAPRLLASRCRSCGTHVFPTQEGCPKCMATDGEVVELAARGRLWTWTIQGFPPKAPPYAGVADPARFRPYGVGYVELPGQVKVETRLTVADPDALRIGMEMELVLEVLGQDEAGDDLVTFAFAPVVEEQA
jgi:uncharacterized OB-fold protein